MRKRLNALIFKVTGGHIPFYVEQRAMLGVKVTLITTEAYELMLAELQWRWLRAFLCGVALITVVGLSSFVMGVRTAWVQEHRSFRYMCGRVIQNHFPPSSEKIRNALIIDYPVADWSLVSPENFRPQGYKP